METTAKSKGQKDEGRLVEQYAACSREYWALLEKRKELLESLVVLSDEIELAAGKTALSVADVIDEFNAGRIELELPMLCRVKFEAQRFGALPQDMPELWEI